MRVKTKASSRVGVVVGVGPITCLHRGLAGQLEDAVGERAVEKRHANSQAVELTLELREDERNGGGAPAGRVVPALTC